MSAAGAIGNETPHRTRHSQATLATRVVARLENQHLPVAAVCDRRSFAKTAIFRLESQQSISAGASPKCIIKGSPRRPSILDAGLGAVSVLLAADNPPGKLHLKS